MKSINVKDHINPDDTIRNLTSKEKAKLENFRTRPTENYVKKNYKELAEWDRKQKEYIAKREKVHKAKQKMVAKWGAVSPTHSLPGTTSVLQTPLEKTKFKAYQRQTIPDK